MQPRRRVCAPLIVTHRVGTEDRRRRRIAGQHDRGGYRQRRRVPGVRAREAPIQRVSLRLREPAGGRQQRVVDVALTRVDCGADADDTGIVSRHRESDATRLAQDREVRGRRLRRADLHEVHPQLAQRVDRARGVGRIRDAEAVWQHAPPNARIAHASLAHPLQVAWALEHRTWCQDARAGQRSGAHARLPGARTVEIPPHLADACPR